MYSLLAAGIIASLSLFVPGMLLAFALLRRTGLETFEIAVMGLIFGLIAPATLTWLEAYLINYIHAFTFSLQLFEANALLLTIIGAALCFKDGIFDDFSKFMKNVLAGMQSTATQASKSRMRIVWGLLVVLMVLTFLTRMQSIVTTPKFYEFDPYFDMIDSEYILTYGHQLLLDPSSWPIIAAGTNHRLQPIVPYLEAFWYALANSLHFHYTTFSTSLMSYIGGIYPPITAAMLVFVIFMLLYHEYDPVVGLIGASLTAAMPVLFTTFIAGEQLVEPWGIFTLFLFFATYMLAIKNPKSKRFAILAGISFASTFLGAHYYTVTAGVMAVYILIEGIIDILRNDSLKDFYRMNAIVLAIIIVLYGLYAPYQATLQSNLSSIIGIPIIIAAPLFALILVAVLDLVPKMLAQRQIVFKEANFMASLEFMAVVLFIVMLLVFFTKVGKPIMSYIELSTRFTTPSKALFMTVQEFIPTGPLYNFASAGFGALGAPNLHLTSAVTVPVMVWLVCFVSIALIFISIGFRKSKTGILYLSVAVPLMAAGFSEVKYLPHFGTAYILLFGIMLGEALYLLKHKNYSASNAKTRDAIMLLAFILSLTTLLLTFSLYSFNLTTTMVLGVLFIALMVSFIYLTRQHVFESSHYDLTVLYNEHRFAVQAVLILGLFFVFGFVFLIVAIAYILIYRYGVRNEHSKVNIDLVIVCVALALVSLASLGNFSYGESASLFQSASAWLTYQASPSNICAALESSDNSMGYSIYCNTMPAYWLNAMAWIRNNVGPHAPRVLSWWDYGDWINWFGNSNAVLRGDNAVAAEDYATAAQLVLGPSYNYTPAALANYMNTNQSKYLLVDEDLVGKWQALDFLACVHINGTSMAYATAQGAEQNPPVPYFLGSSQCETNHDPQYVLLPLAALLPSNSTSLQQSLSNYCSISTSKDVMISAYLVIGNSVSNKTVCVDSTPGKNGVLSVYNTTGSKINAVVQSSQYMGVVNIAGMQFVEYLLVYLPNAPNGTISDAPSQFYSSNFYKAFFLGNLPGFTEVYPANAPGINYVNGTYAVRIYSLNNFTGTLPTVPAKPAWVSNNYQMP
jgi:asparagine N-glycosylation enzyme membrane subunit Stt3